MAKNNDVILLHIGGRNRLVKFGHKALKHYQAISGVNLEDIGKNGFDIETIEQLIYCALLSDAKTHNEVLKLEDMEDWLDEMDEYNEVIDKITLALSKSFGHTDDPNSKRVATKK